MEPFTLPLAAWLAGAVGLTAAGALFTRRRAKASAAPLALAAGAAPGEVGDPFGGQFRRVELRLETMESLQADVLGRIEALGDDDAAERRLQAMAARILGLVRDKDASLDVALAGLDQLRARLRVLEQMGDLAETRGLFERQAERLEAAEARLKGLEATTPPFADLAERMARLHGQRDAIAETAFARLAPLEAGLARLAPLEAKLREIDAVMAARDPQAGLDRLAERLAPLETRLSGLEAGVDPQHGINRLAERLEALQTQREAGLEARLSDLEAGARDPQAELDRLAERLEALRAAQEALGTALAGRLAALEGAGDPAAELAERLAALQAQREAALSRLGPLEAKLEAVEAASAARDPQAGFDRLAERLEALRGAQEAATAGLAERLAGRLAGIEAGTEARLAALERAESPAADLAERLAALQAQREVGIEAAASRLAPLEAALVRLAPLEAKLEAVEAVSAARDARPALDRLAADLAEDLATLGARLAALEGACPEPEAEAARLEAQAIAVQMVAARTVAEETRLFANRLALLEASLPRLSIAQALMMQALERQAAPQAAAWPLAEPGQAGEAEPARLPRLSPVPKG